MSTRETLSARDVAVLNALAAVKSWYWVYIRSLNKLTPGGRAGATVHALARRGLVNVSRYDGRARITDEGALALLAHVEKLSNV